MVFWFLLLEAQQETGDGKTALKQHGVTLIPLALEARDGDEGHRLSLESRKLELTFVLLILIMKCIYCKNKKHTNNYIYYL